MPLVSTRGAASAKAFGWTGKTGGGGYAYVSQGSPSTGNVYAGSSVATATLLPTQPTNRGTNGFVAIVAHGAKIASTQYYSGNNGVTWAEWNGISNGTNYLPMGLNGAAAYNPTAKRLLTYRIDADPKSSQWYITTAPLDLNTGVGSGGSIFYIGTSLQVRNITYSPTVNTFYINSWGSSNANYRYIDGTTGVGGNTVALGSNANYQPGLSNNGYPLIPIFVGGVTFQLREYTSSDLSTYNNLGGISDGYYTYPRQSPWLWFPVNNKYIVACAPNTGGSIYIRSSTSGSPASLSLIGTISGVSNYAIISCGLMEEADGRLWLSGIAQFYDPKGGYYLSTYTQYSLDGGVSWAGGSSRLGSSKNFAT